MIRQQDRTIQAAHGWTAPWYSSFGGDFNYDFHVTQDEAVAPAEYNYRSKAEHERNSESYFTQREMHGVSACLHDGDQVFHTYSTTHAAPN